MNEPHPQTGLRPGQAGFWLGQAPRPGEAPAKLATRLPPGDVIMYQRRGDREWVHAIQDCFADAEVASHLADCIPGQSRELAARFARLRQRDLDLLALATPEQLAIGWGDHWTWTSPSSGLACWGWVEPLATMMAQEFEACARHGIPQAQAEPEVQARADAIKENYGRGWRSGRGWSVVEPDGEYGYSHVALLTPCTRAEFAAAAARGWL